jgi:sulfotransferase
MDKTYHFLAGLPRSGNTLLSSLLNQNPIIYSTPISPVPAYLWQWFEGSNRIEQIHRNVENRNRSEGVLRDFLNNFYKDVNTPIVIEREKYWGLPHNVELIKRYLTPNPKIIFTVRDIDEILASYLNVMRPVLEKELKESVLCTPEYLSLDDAICEYIMAPTKDLDKCLLSLASAFYPENKGVFHIVEYNDLVTNPQETIDKIYEFLELPSYKHDFLNIQKIDRDDDVNVGLPANLHEVRSTLSSSKTDTSILSPYIRHKYSNMEFWRKDSLMKVSGKDF